MSDRVQEAVAPIAQNVLGDQWDDDVGAPELLERWIRRAAPELDSPREVAVQLLDWSGGPVALSRTPARVIAKRWGLPHNAVEAFQIAARLGAHAALAPPALARVTGSRSVFERFAWLGRSPRETFWVLGLGSRNHVLVEERVAEGGANLCALLPRDVLRPLVCVSAVQAILIHNHPSGDPTPSVEDLSLTRRLMAAGDLVGVGILDHVVVGAGTWLSLLDEGLMEVER